MEQDKNWSKTSERNFLFNSLFLDSFIVIVTVFLAVMCVVILVAGLDVAVVAVAVIVVAVVSTGFFNAAMQNCLISSLHSS